MAVDNNASPDNAENIITKRKEAHPVRTEPGLIVARVAGVLGFAALLAASSPAPFSVKAEGRVRKRGRKKACSFQHRV